MISKGDYTLESKQWAGHRKRTPAEQLYLNKTGIVVRDELNTLCNEFDTLCKEHDALQAEVANVCHI